MAPPLVRLLLLLAAVPFLIWFGWAAWARRSGRPMGSTPWAWLAALAAVLVGISLVVGGLLHPDNRGQTYVPGEVNADGTVSKGRFEANP